MKKTVIISGFPGVGKSYFTRSHENFKKVVLDSDSSKFSWAKNAVGKRNPDFPENYIKHIKSSIGKVDYIFVSSHEVVRNELGYSDLDFIMIVPDIKLKEEYLQRYRDRLDNVSFIEFMNKNWETFITDINNRYKSTNQKMITLKQGQFLSDCIEEIDAF